MKHWNWSLILFLWCFSILSSCAAATAQEHTLKHYTRNVQENAHSAATPARILQQEVERRGPPGEDTSQNQKKKQKRQSTLADVWLCLAFSLGWTVWMVASHVRPQVEQYSMEAILVYGNVLSSSIIIGDTTTGIPTYRAVVDYILTDTPEETQVRKEFTTDRMLEEGFANVEILVLPSDPTSGVLKRDWEREYDEFLETQERRKRGRTCSLLLGALLVTFSIVGAVLSVTKLPVELTTWGWVSIAVGVALLWPVAILLWVNGNVISNLATQSETQKGVVIRGEQPPLAFSLNPCASMDTGDGTSGGGGGSLAGSPARSKRKEPVTVKPPAIELSRISTKDIQIPPSLLRDRVKVTDDSTEIHQEAQGVGCYFVNLPTDAFCRGRSHQSRGTSMSSVSSNSQNGAVNANIVHPPSSPEKASGGEIV